MKKPKFSGEEISDLLQRVKELNDDLLSYDQLSIVTECLASYSLLQYQERSEQEKSEYPILDAHLSIAAHAHDLECQAKVLRATVRAFTKPMKEIPKDMNSTDKIIAEIANWRLKLGK